MQLEEYEKTIDQFALNESRNSMYLALGLNGEAGELAEEVKKMLRDSGGQLEDDRRVRMIKEAGDVMWYNTMSLLIIGESMGAALRMIDSKLVEHHASTTDLNTLAISVNSAAGQLGEAVIVMSNGSDVLAISYKASILIQASRVFFYLKALLIKIDSSLEEAAQFNVDKLISRKERNLIHGSGGER